MTGKANWVQRFNRRVWRIGGAVNFHPGPIINNGPVAPWLRRSVKVIDDDTLEIRNYKMGKRWVWLFIAILVIGGWVVKGPMNFNIYWVPKPIMGLIAPEYFAEASITLRENSLRSGKPYLEPDRSERIQLRADSAREERVFGFFMLLVFAGPPLYWLFGPALRGVRIDRRRNVIYSWSWFSFYIQRPQNPDLRDIETFYAPIGPVRRLDYELGPLVIALPKASNPRKIHQFKLGQSPDATIGQNAILHEMIAQFLANRKTDPDWLTELREERPYRRNPTDWAALIARVHFVPAFWPKSTEKRIEAYIAAEDAMVPKYDY
ncbi:hypothetical protein TRM7557_01761 [Tritonibacter multivorans]|uniref:Uncharacterized protein n=1 Tax=Tritonibacter multivorans TaxID=928856 RepID=A0A0P1GA02_9RHOB|nr:hypothetical protein [Tritonibacter multivorans]MDA7423004.1 hypothetical protein [Tritonibacter multivorans]CUH78186.1 hypothetical protein TRM7557_01761 [Tritonibacter multivorans]SFD76552.1 hypothetical protein SAMN04488049_1283 [Tritonibacter multivorans]